MIRWKWPPRLAFVLLAACGGAPDHPADRPPPAPASATPPPPPSTSASASASAEPAASSSAPAIELPGNAACLLVGSWRGRQGTTKLLLRPDGPAFADIHGGSAKLSFPLGERPSTQALEVAAGGIVVRGHVDADAADLRAQRPFLLSELAFPTVFTRLHWTEGAEGGLTVTTETPKALELLETPLTARRPCEDVSIGGGSFSPDEAIKGSKNATPKQLVQGRPIDIAREPGGKPVARAHPEKDADFVDVLEVSGQSSRISWHVDTLIVVGWVSSKDLRKASPGAGYGSGSGRLGGKHIGGHGKRVTCAADVSLIVEAGGERATAGTIHAGTTIEMFSISGVFTTIVVRSGMIEPAEGASWLARSVDLDRCSPSP